MQYVKLDPRAKDLKVAKPGDAGFDLSILDGIQLSPFGGTGYKHLLKTGIAIGLWTGFVGLIVPRSSMSKRGIMLANTIGIIDSGYRGELMLYVQNMNPYFIELEAGERIAQLIVIPYGYASHPKDEYEQPELVTKLNETERGSGGFGSTGT